VLYPWKIAVVTNEHDPASRCITADLAVEWREDKAEPVLLLINVDTAGAGMDGIYSAAREVTEEELFGTCLKLAHDRLPHGCKRFAEAARRKARHTSRNQSLSPWREFSYLCRASLGQHALGEALPEIALWPIATDEVLDLEDLDRSARLVERLLPRVGNRQSPEARVAGLRLPESQADEARKLTAFLNDAERSSRLDALQRLELEEELWINRLQPGVFDSQSLHGIEWSSWRGKTGKLLAWSGLTDNADQRAELRLNGNFEELSNRARLEVRWKTDPAQMAKGTVDYIVQIKSGNDVLAEKSVSHRPKNFQQCVFTQDDFGDLDENDRFEAQAIIRALAGDTGEEPGSPFRAESEEFILLFGEQATVTKNSIGRVYPTLALAVVDIAQDEPAFQQIASDIANPHIFSLDKKGYIACRHNGKTARVLCPNLLRDLAICWAEQGGSIGRWRQRVRADGSIAGAPEFVPMSVGDDQNGQRCRVRQRRHRMVGIL
jgi:DNA phosphorothioation-dependent restriction protein DptH